MAQKQSPPKELLETLAGRSCEYCEEGILERGRYKGNEAVVCNSCGAPEVQFW